MKETIAIIGSGIAGASATYYLRQKYNVTVFEKEPYFGGHVHTHSVNDFAGNTVQLDTGFVFFNKPRYPKFLALLQDLRIGYEPSELTFGAQINEDLYSGNTWWNVAEQTMNDNKQFNQVLLQFFQHVAQDLADINPEISLYEYVVGQLKLPEWFLHKVLLPLAAGAWSNDFLAMRSYQAKPVLQFLDQHGFLGTEMLFKWHCIPGGYDQYITAIREQSNAQFHPSTPVLSVQLHDTNVTVQTEKNVRTFDRIIFACHTDTALQLLRNPSDKQYKALSAFEFHNNHGYLHTDSSFWNTETTIPGLIFHLPEGKPACLTSHLNPLQNIQTDTAYFFTLNPSIAIKKEHIIKKITYRHTSITNAVYSAQADFHAINSENRAHFVGAYWGKAYHEDGIESALRVCKILGIRP